MFTAAIIRVSMRVVLAAVTAFGTAACGHGRVATRFTDLAPKVRAGSTAYVTSRDGQQTRGTLVDVSDASLRLRLADSGIRHFAESDVSTVRLKDPLWNGLLIGAAVGGLPIAAIADEGCTSPNAVPDCDKVSRGEVFAYGAAGGAAIGAVLDLLHRKQVYRNPSVPRRSVMLLPLVGRRHIGVAFSSRF